jgi:uncharacterized repeat protein (TIGR03847 family)
MSELFDYREPTHFTAGAIGEPGNRTFFIQAGDEYSMTSVKCEKQHVQALAQFLSSAMEDQPTPDFVPSPDALKADIEPTFVAGQISIGENDVEPGFVLMVEEFVLPDDDELDPVLEDLGLDLGEEQGSRMRVHISLQQAASFLAGAKELMQGGRPPCRLCGFPEDPDGHICPRLN